MSLFQQPIHLLIYYSKSKLLNKTYKRTSRLPEDQVRFFVINSITLCLSSCSSFPHSITIFLLLLLHHIVWVSNKTIFHPISSFEIGPTTYSNTSYLSKNFIWNVKEYKPVGGDTRVLPMSVPLCLCTREAVQQPPLCLTIILIQDMESVLRPTPIRTRSPRTSSGSSRNTSHVTCREMKQSLTFTWCDFESPPLLTFL